MPTLTHWLLLSALVFSIGLYGVLTRRSNVSLLLALELMACAVHINLVALGQHRGDETGQVMTVIGIGLALVSVIVGLSILMLMQRASLEPHDNHSSEVEV